MGFFNDNTNRFKCFILAIAGIIFFLPQTTQASWDYSGRQKARVKSRWTLASWLEQKKTIAAQNAWLSAHVNKMPIDGALSFSQTPERLGMSIDFYMNWLGFRLSHEHPVTYYPGFTDYEIGGARSRFDFQLRLFGDNIQNSTLVLRGGVGYDDVRGVSGFDSSYMGIIVEPELQIYLAHFVGVIGSWGYRLPAKSTSNNDLFLSGTSWKAGAFLEMGAFRTEVGYEQRDWNFRTRASTTTSGQTLSNLYGAIRIFY